MKHSYLIFIIILFTGCSYLGEPKGEYENTVEETADYIQIQSPNGNADKGLLFYPGGLVDANAYRPLCDKIVSARPDLLLIIVKMPVNLAVFSPEKGLKYKKKHSAIQNWLIAGHSLGGSMAARVVHEHPDDFRGLIFFGAYPAESDNLSNWNGNVLSISAEHDGLCTPNKIENNKPLLPTPYLMQNPTDIPAASEAYTAYFQIPGANHAQFGSYGTQKGDGEASISPNEQHMIMVQSLQTFVEVLW